MIETRVAFRIDILWLNQSPGESPGCFFVYRIIGKCVAIIFCHNTCGSTGLQETPCEYYETDECNAKEFYVNHLGKLYSKSTINFKYDMKKLNIYLEPKDEIMHSRSIDCFIELDDCSHFPKVKKLHLRLSEQSVKMFWDEEFYPGCRFLKIVYGHLQ
jgi:hypothetical protein